jgi:hypothetical protein
MLKLRQFFTPKLQISKIVPQSCLILSQSYSTKPQETYQTSSEILVDTKNDNRKLHIPVMLNEINKFLVEETSHFKVNINNENN